MKRTRRGVLRIGGMGLTATALAGCLRLGSSREEGTPNDASFVADYDSGSLVIRYQGGGSLPAGRVEIRSSSGKTVTWNELGSTSPGRNQTLERNQTATLGPGVINWQTEITSGETLYVVFIAEDGSPTTLAKFSIGDSVSDTSDSGTNDGGTNTDAGESSPPTDATFQDGFEDGSMERWQVVNLHDKNPSGGGNDWKVSSNGIQGTFGLQIDSNGDSTDNTIATVNRVLDMGRDFVFSYRWRTPDPSNRGPHMRSLQRDGTDFTDTTQFGELWANEGININFGPDAISRAGSPYTGRGGFSGTSIDRESYAAETPHTVRVEKVGNSATLYLDETEVATATVGTAGKYRILFMSSGTYGTPSTMVFDDVTIKYQ